MDAVSEPPRAVGTEQPGEVVRRLARELAGVAQTGLHWAGETGASVFDVERYEQCRRIAADLLVAVAGVDPSAVRAELALGDGHATPKLDVRGVVLDAAGRVLLVSERLDDGRWTLPGGWVDPGEAPREAVAREVREETGLDVVATRLVALQDRDRHNTGMGIAACWKAFIACDVVGGALRTSTTETADAGWFPVDGLPPMSTSRVTPDQLRAVVPVAADPDRPPLLD